MGDTISDCAICERPMKPGQKRADTDKGRAHHTCAELVDQTSGTFDVLSFMRSVDERDDDDAAELVLHAFTEVRAGIAEAVVEAIPSKGTMLRRMMDHAADRLEERLEWDRNRTLAYGEKHYGPRLVASMQEAATILRTVAIYVMDDAA